MRIALLASRRLRHGPLSPLLRFARDFMPFLQRHEIVTTEGCCRAFYRAGLFWSHGRFNNVGAGYEGALVRITSDVVSGASRSIDVVIYLVDPRDPSSNFPETNALKRECVVHEKPFLATSRSARLWAALNWADDSEAQIGNYVIDLEELSGREYRLLPLGQHTVALIAHDAKKEEMLIFARDHFDFLLAFGRRVGTGTTAELLNGSRPVRLNDEEWNKLAPYCTILSEKIESAKATKPFVELCRSGPKGGDVQIARLVLDKGCQSIVFFEDPDIARQHEQDIQLLERTGRTRGKEVICVHDRSTAAKPGS